MSIFNAPIEQPDHAAPGEVLFGKPTQELAGEQFPHVFHDNLQLKGIHDLFPTYKLIK